MPKIVQGKGIHGSKFQVNPLGFYWITNGMSGNPHTYLNSQDLYERCTAENKAQI